jgi:hypothetical protein
MPLRFRPPLTLMCDYIEAERPAPNVAVDGQVVPEVVRGIAALPSVKRVMALRF